MDSKSRSLPTSTVTQITSRLYVSCSHLMATEVSRPPEYARMTLSICSSSRAEGCRTGASRNKWETDLLEEVGLRMGDHRVVADGAVPHALWHVAHGVLD